MALINCDECKKQVSDKARSCPHCGYPLIESADSAVDATEQILISSTVSKRLKSHIVLSKVFFWTGFLIALGHIYAGEYAQNALHVALGLMAFGIIWYLVTTMRIWWHHK